MNTETRGGWYDYQRSQLWPLSFVSFSVLLHVCISVPDLLWYLAGMQRDLWVSRDKFQCLEHSELIGLLLP
jgi:hypothetical protein